MMKRILSVVLVVGTLTQSGSAVAPQTTTTITGSWAITVADLGLLPGGSASTARGINNLGTIVGMATDASFAIQRVLWDTSGNLVGTLPNYDPSSTAAPSSINDNGEVAGTEDISTTLHEGVYWANTTGVYVAFGLPALNGGSQSRITARAIDKNGWIAGSSQDGATGGMTAVLWNRATAPISLGVPGEAFGVADANGTPHAVGVYATGSNTRGFLWRSGRLTDLGAVGGSAASSRATAVSETGYIAGTSDGDTLPVRWRYDNTVSTSIATLEQLPMPSGFVLPAVAAVNADGDVVGSAWTSNFARTHAILWRNGEAIDLGTWPGGASSKAFGINAVGQIVGEGDVDGSGRNHALLWTVSRGTTPPPNMAPSVSITSLSSTSLKIGDALVVTGRFVDPDNGPWTYSFDWGDGSATPGSAALAGSISASHVYTKVSPKRGYKVVLTVTDAVGASGQVSSANIKVTK